MHVVPKQIGLLDAMGGGNLGDAAIQDSVIANIRSRLPAAGIVGFSFVPADTVKRHGIPCYPITRHSGKSEHAGGHSVVVESTLRRALKDLPALRALARPVAEVVREALFLARTYRVLRSLDLLIMSGGGQLCELWGGPWAHLCNLFKFSVLARLAGKRLYFLNVGAEPLEHWLSRFFAGFAVRLADYVSFRDDYSRTLVRSLGVKAKAHVSADPAYALDVTNYLAAAPGESSKPTVGINPIGYCDPRIWPHKDQSVYEAYLEKLATFSLWLLEQGYCLKMFTTSAAVDKYAVADLKRQLLERVPSGESIGGPFESSGDRVKEAVCGSVTEVLKEMAACNFIVTSKYHGVVFSHMLRKPVIALGYQKKIDVAMQAVGQEQFCTSIETFETEWIIRAFRSLIQSREAIKSREAAAVAAYADTLRNQFDELFSPGINTHGGVLV